MIALPILAIVALAAYFAYHLYASSPAFLERQVASAVAQLSRPTVVVQTKDRQTLSGVLVGAHRDVLVLAHASYLEREGRTPLVGEVVIPRDNVAFLQLDPTPEVK